MLTAYERLDLAKGPQWENRVAAFFLGGGG